MITAENIAGAIGATLLFLIFWKYNKNNICITPVTIIKSGNKIGSKYIAINIMYFISPPPKIELGNTSNIITKNIRIVNEIIKE